jgi:type IV secretory pathway TrbD component
MRLLRSIQKDLLWLNTHLPLAVKIGLVIVVIAIAVKAWWLGSAYWMERVAYMRWMTVPRPRIEIVGMFAGMILVTYLTLAAGRDRD